MVGRQKFILAVGTTLLVLAGLFPPWNFVVVTPNSGGDIKRPAGYAPLFSPPIIKVVKGARVEAVTNGTQFEKALNDPKFYALPEKAQIEVLTQYDPEFGRLAPTDQRTILKMYESAFRLKPTSTPDVEPNTGWEPRFVNVELNWGSLLVEWIVVILATGGLFLFCQATKSKPENPA
jgi:hypothetical protein